MEMCIETYERAIELIGATPKTSFMGSKDVDEEFIVNVIKDHYIVWGERRTRVRMSLVHMPDRVGKGTAKAREDIAFTFIDAGATDRTIMGRYNKLLREIEEYKKLM